MARLALLVVVGMILQDGGDRGGNWSRYSARKGGFRVLLPGRPEEKDDRIALDTGKLDYHTVTASDGATIYSVVFHDNPPIAPSARETYLQRQADGFLQLKRGDRLEDKEIALGEHPGRELVFEGPPDRNISREDILWKIRYYLVGDRLYQLMTARPKSLTSSKDVDAFLTSFELRGGQPDAEPVEWKPLRPEGGGFSVSFPAGPTETKTTLDAPGGALTSRGFAAKGGTIGYSLTYVDYGAAAVRDPKRLLDAARDGAVTLCEGKLVREKRIRLGRHPGRSFDVEIPVGDDPKAGLASYRIYLVGRRVYQLIATGPKEARPIEEIEGFFQSFRLDAPK